MPPTSMGMLISDLYTYSLSVVGLCVFIMFLYAGVGLLVGFVDKGKAIKIFQDAVIGTVLLYSAYVILNSINHDLVSQSSSIGASNPNSSFSAGGTTGTGSSGIGSTSNIIAPTSTPFQPGGGSFGGGGATSSF